MKGIEIRDFMGDYALDIPMGEGCVHTIYFNSRRNAEMVKRIMEVDDSVPNAATVCDVAEVRHAEWIAKSTMFRSPSARNYYCSACQYEPIEAKSYCPECGAKMDGERKEQT